LQLGAEIVKEITAIQKNDHGCLNIHRKRTLDCLMVLSICVSTESDRVHIIKEAKLTVDQFNDEGSVPILVLNGVEQNMTCQLLMIL